MTILITYSRVWPIYTAEDTLYLKTLLLQDLKVHRTVKSGELIQYAVISNSPEDLG